MKQDYPLQKDLKSSRLALGCMQLGVSWEKGACLTDSIRQRTRSALETVLELGWNFFDHADIYCRGLSEVVFGEVMQEMKVSREDMIIQTKCGICFGGEPKESDPHRCDFSKEHILASVDGSLARLGTDYLDILLLHRPDLLAEPEEVMAAFDVLKKNGKVRAFGCSNFPPHLLDLFKAAGFIPVANQVELNLLRTSLIDAMVVEEDRRPTLGHLADGALEWHRRHGVVTQAWAPMAYGYLSGRKLDNKNFDKAHVQEAAGVVQEIASAHSVSQEAIVIAWLLRHPAKIQPVIGTHDPQRLKACDEALSVQLTREDWYRLYTAGRGRPLP